MHLQQNSCCLGESTVFNFQVQSPLLIDVRLMKMVLIGVMSSKFSRKLTCDKYLCVT